MIHIPTEEKIAANASLAMVLEAASYPKPGNVHRLRDFKDTSLEHFLASAVSTQSVFEKSAFRYPGEETPAFGPLFYEAVIRSGSNRNGGNTHFGTFTLLLPLTAAAGFVLKEIGTDENEAKIGKRIVQKASEICRSTTPDDAVCFYKAFETLSIPVQKPEKGRKDYDLDLTNPAAIEKIRLEEIPLFDIMAMGAARDMVAAEWVNGFEKSLLFAEKLRKNKDRFEAHPEKCFKSVINSAVVYTFLEFLARYPDTFIVTKYDEKKARKVQKEAAEILKKSKKSDLKKIIPDIQKLDDKLWKNKINPGSLADIAAAGIFIALSEGLII
ncbi:2-(5''-triphosphoribosyl)-3'-dephosphocoenzyme-A synthase [Methanimicrococcus sp. At1]|uniref:2-(5''-triphosphoribosyl)-3'-dephosphocoenzyme-A synthase n=1 Tax=Methanimicrococcus hacksteinii TaxID=3028293 RepID=A0ABU3VQ15_9EURY|nr:triphosphoribosyl-dephospho-CoA synthase [Methanimicrococcus sp. At1]MDV0445507.1 2-(5''-triphosphoribosyl)-3'-dephosphocoenzyme-A synthase [Methanimicrococcus sp. At1]